jgi:hypothetical protein
MRKIAIPVLALLLNFGFSAPVLAGDQGTSCPTDPERVRFYENNIGDTSDGNDTVIFCGTGASDLNQIEHTLPGLCKSDNLLLGDYWNDCISSLYPIIPSGRVLCLYGSANFQGPGKVEVDHDASGARFNLAPGYGLNDGLSSWHFLNDGPQFLGC